MVRYVLFVVAVCGSPIPATAEPLPPTDPTGGYYIYGAERVARLGGAHVQRTDPTTPAMSASPVGWDLEAGAIAGTYYIDGAAPRAGGVALAGGAHVGPIGALAELDGFALSPQQAMPPIAGSNANALDGQLIRAGASARLCNGCANRSSWRVWAEAGVGREWINWTAGGSLARNDGLFGAGAALGRGQPDWLGLQLRLVAIVARSHDSAIAACGGPCDIATSPSRWDRTFLFELGGRFGR
jgi:hypothetical protein